jgi:hypothetical protein
MKKQKLVSLVEAIVLLNEAYQNNPEKSGRDVVSKKTIYNALSSGRLKRYGSFHFRQVDVDELLKEFGPDRTA